MCLAAERSRAEHDPWGHPTGVIAHASATGGAELGPTRDLMKGAGISGGTDDIRARLGNGAERGLRGEWEGVARRCLQDHLRGFRCVLATDPCRREDYRVCIA